MFEPQIMCFLCKWCTSAAADLAGTSRMTYAPNGVNLRVMCSSRIDPQHILYAFRAGADGVFIGGCHPGDSTRAAFVWNGFPRPRDASSRKPWTSSPNRFGASGR